MINIQIHKQKIDDNHNSSVFYYGVIATAGGYRARAVGEIKIIDKKEDKTIKQKPLNADKYNDNDLKKETIEWVNNNWFEIQKRPTTNNPPKTIVKHTYDQAIKTLKEIREQDDKLQEVWEKGKEEKNE